MFGQLFISKQEREKNLKMKKMILRYRGELFYTIETKDHFTGAAKDERQGKFTVLLYENQIGDKSYELIGDEEFKKRAHVLDRWHDLEVWVRGGMLPDWCIDILQEKLSK